jgi:dTDP-4-amino-4,6-dideoxygalactose transaminase
VKHEHEIEGINSRMDGLQASLLTAKLTHIDEWTAARRRVAARYDEALRGVGDLALPRVRDGATHVYHLYVVATARRDALRSHLAAREIETAVHYPTALPLLPAYARLGLTAADIPNAARNQARILSLPIYPEITDEQVEHVVGAVRDFFARR